MIEHLRKYTGLIIVLFVLVIIGFVFLDSSSIRAASGGVPVLKIGNSNYSNKEYQKIGSSSLELTKSLASARDLRLFTFLLSMGVNFGNSSNETTETFFVNRILLKKAKSEFGVQPSEEAIDSFIRGLQAFQGPDGAFSQVNYKNFIEKRIGRLGLTEKDVRELASDILAQEKLASILGSGLNDNKDFIGKELALEKQIITAELVSIPIDPIQEKIQLTEEEIKAYWETVQDAYRTEEQRSFTYLMAKPAEIELPPALAPLPLNATEEMKKEFETKTADRDAAIVELRRKAQMESDAKADRFLTKLGETEQPDFEKLAAEEGFEIKKTEPFKRTEAPAPLNGQLRASSQNGTVASELFKITPTSDAFSKISPGIPTGEREWIIARLDETVPVRVKTYEEARNESRAQLIADKANADLLTAANETTEKIRTAIKDGKPFAEAVKTAGILTEPVKLTELSSNSKVETSKAPYGAFNLIRYANPGEVMEPIIESDRAFIVYIENRKVAKDEQAEATIQSKLESGEFGLKNIAFEAWLKSRREIANVQRVANN